MVRERAKPQLYNYEVERVAMRGLLYLVCIPEPAPNDQTERYSAYAVAGFTEGARYNQALKAFGGCDNFKMRLLRDNEIAQVAELTEEPKERPGGIVARLYRPDETERIRQSAAQILCERAVIC